MVRTAAEIHDVLGQNVKVNANIPTATVEIRRAKSSETVREQRRWFQNQLEKYRNKKFIFVVSHHPQIYNTYKKLEMTGILEQNRVSAYFNGHMHNYTHHLDSGVHYFTSGGGGPRINLTPLPKKSLESLVKESISTHYLLVEVGINEARVSALTQSNTLIELTTIPARN